MILKSHQIYSIWREKGSNRTGEKDSAKLLKHAFIAGSEQQVLKMIVKLLKHKNVTNKPVLTTDNKCIGGPTKH